MRVTRILDLIVIALLAAILLMPRPDVTVKVALRLSPERRERVAELQAAMLRPGQDDPLPEAIELADIYLDGHRPDWALATVGAVLPLHQDDYRLHNIRAIAFADRFESEPAFAAASRALELCERPAPAVPPCGEAARSRLHLLHATLASVAGVDMRNNPALAKEKIFEQLRPTFIPRRSKPATKP
ncbi:MAG TPA: hypothetical protein VH374_06180 [Polyangia bacterium]|nr:hypothetical protein [Polyangia bacterium]